MDPLRRFASLERTVAGLLDAARFDRSVRVVFNPAALPRVDMHMRFAAVALPDLPVGVTTVPVTWQPTAMPTNSYLVLVSLSTIPGHAADLRVMLRAGTLAIEGCSLLAVNTGAATIPAGEAAVHMLGIDAG